MRENRFVEDLILQEFTDSYLPPHQSGPDHVIPNEDYRTWVADGSIKINNVGEKPMSVVTFVRRSLKKMENKTLLAAKRNDVWVKWTANAYLNEIYIAAKGFIKLGLRRFHGVGILGFNAPEWNISHFAAIFAGGLAAGIYTTNSADACCDILNDCSADIIVVENKAQVNKILQVRGSLPNLKIIIQYTGTSVHPDVISWEDLLKIGRSLPDDVLDKRIKSLSVNQCCCIVYTSGTVGKPKGVMISHDNITHLITYLAVLAPEFRLSKGVAVSYLPLSHIAALAFDLYVHLEIGTELYFANPDALKGKLVDTLLEVNPTTILAVPRVYEKIAEKINETEVEMTGMKKNIFNFAKKQALNYHFNLKNKRSSSQPFMHSIAKKLVFNKIHKRLGTNRTSAFFCGGAPVSAETQKYMTSLNIPLVEGYGLSESSGPHIVAAHTALRVGAVGCVGRFPLYEVRIDSPDEKGCGEILLRGRNIFMGYLNMEANSLAAKSEDGWLHTDDIGMIDKDNLLYVTGRIKEIIITSGGENVPPVIIEDKVKELLPIISNCMLIGDRRKFLSMLITLKTEMDMDTLLPLDKLTVPAIKWCIGVGSQSTTVSDIIRKNDSKVMAAIQAGIDNYNSNFAISNAQKIQKWIILPKDFCMAHDELGPTTKLKRPFILKKYNDVIETLYS